jgi:SP family general alpha glucoside:H+ symporter-like MFS transporter
MAELSNLAQTKQEGSAESKHVELVGAQTEAAGELGRELVNVAEDARLATEDEHRMTLMEAIKKYPKACLWSIVISLAVIMDGYDTALLGSLSAFPSFRTHFGHYVSAKDGYQIAAKWQVALGCSSPVGNIIGIYLGAMTTEVVGYRKSLLFWLTILTGFIFIPFFAPNIETLFVGELLCGLAWGVFSTMAPAYASEVSPVVLRGYLETYIVLCWGIGQLLSYSVLLTLNDDTSNWGWRIPFAVQWIWPVIIFPMVLLAPESPWWLVRKGKIDEAEKAVVRLSSKSNQEGAKRAVALMVETNDLEKTMTEGVGYIECFRGTNLWRTEIACACWAIQVFSGFVISGYATYFYELAGLPSLDAYKMSVGSGGLHFVFTCLTFPLVTFVGRRRIYLWGLVWMGTMMFLIGFISLAPGTSAAGYASSAIFLSWFCCYELTIGPGAFIIASEVSATRLRAKTIGLARNSWNLANLVNYLVSPYILNPTNGNWKGKAGFLAGGLCILSWTWTFLRLPETKGRTYEELDILFSSNIKAREFKNYPVDVMGHHEGKETNVE